MTYKVALSDEAKKRLLRVDSPLRARLIHRFHELAEAPFDPRLSSPLVGRLGFRKSRVGDWRIIFTVDKAAGIVYVATVATRGQVYRGF